MSADRVIFVIEQDAATRAQRSAALAAEGFAVESFASGAEFLAAYSGVGPACIVADLEARDPPAAELLTAIAEQGWTLPVIFVSEPGMVVDAVAALKRGAFDFLETPVAPAKLRARVEAALERDTVLRAAAAERARRVTRMPGLTVREHDVVIGVVSGFSNKVIALQLGISPRTVEVYRAQAMRKLGARSLADLIQIVMRRHPEVS